MDEMSIVNKALEYSSGFRLKGYRYVERPKERPDLKLSGDPENQHERIGSCVLAAVGTNGRNE